MDTQSTSAATNIRIRVLAFARVREIIGAAEVQRSIESGATIQELWQSFVHDQPELALFSSSIRFACEGELAQGSHLLVDGNEVAFLPPVSGG